MEKNVLSKIYDRRFRRVQDSKSAKSRGNAWRALYKSELSTYVQQDMAVVDLGSGPGYFINQVEANKRFAVDLDENNKQFLNKNIEFIKAQSDDLNFATNDSVDLVFTSNLFEHLQSVENLFQTLYEIKRILKKNGHSRLIILMPNVRYAKWDFYNFIDHKLPLNEKSLSEALEICGFEIQILHKRFFPYSAQDTTIAIPEAMIQMYLRIPPRLRPFAKQMYFVAGPTTYN